MTYVDESEVKSVSQATLRRLPKYLHLLRNLKRRGRDAVSCSFIAERLSFDPTQVRKDLAVTGVIGKPKVGHETGELIDAIEQFLGWNNVTEGFLVGVGNLGAALLGYDRFNHYGLKIVAAFDKDPAKVGKSIGDYEVLPLEKLPDLARRMNILMGIITVPAEAAQSVADLMVAGGIRAIWNFAPVNLQAPEPVIVQDEELYATLAILSRHLAKNLNSEKLERGIEVNDLDS